ncbi:hypothetical protein BDN71DRAFT_1444863 [Pleurotus eryngii]|uniref:BAG domain-containing protein n=1 Tax=Pleurotus eryngii TaxID=5323 RepID=A0A9P6D8V4_PLEER|nr:hypothetical protein BDN71DRAFT_1444863 [Pleurotus eryngii]
MFSYNPYQSNYYFPYDNYYPSPSYARARALAQERAKTELRERSRALAAQQMMRDRYLVPEYEEDRNSSDEEYSSYGAGDYTPYGYAPGYGSSYDPSPRERASLQAKYRDEREKKELLRRRLAQEELIRRQQVEEAFHATRSPSPRKHTIPVRSPSPEPCPQRLPSPPHSPQASPRRRALPQQSSSPHVGLAAPIEKLNEAALTIQRAYRVHHALRAVKSLSSQFEQLRDNFQRPSKLDFQGPSSEIITIDVHCPPASIPPTSPKLAYTSTNVPLHGYVELLNRLLVALDAVESHGAREVRDMRKQVVRMVEHEASAIEQWWKNMWERRDPAAEETEGSRNDHAMDESIAICEPSAGSDATQEHVDHDDNVRVDEDTAASVTPVVDKTASPHVTPPSDEGAQSPLTL